ncbi:Ydc2-catalyt-domain-containing protein [Xylariomycetidae sp. FL2044]|nr:Ydc2-catalyt-domain-containing protein [Xylariomycetidae sp. FL2044]
MSRHVLEPWKNLKAYQLKRLALICGLPLSATKSELERTLRTTVADIIAGHRHSIAKWQRDPQSLRVLSIDMGIRNLAFSLITPGTTLPTPADARCDMTEYTQPLPIRLETWRRVDLVEGLGRQDKEPDFSPLAMAGMTSEYLRKYLPELKPTHVLIERQRFRSGGGAAVQEWTLRVNTLEAMLHSSLLTMRELGTTKVFKGIKNLQTTSVLPGRVGALWLSGDAWLTGKGKVGSEMVAEGVTTGAATETKQDSKKLKIDLAGRWIDRGDIITVGNGRDAEVTLKAFHHIWRRTYAKRALNKHNMKRDVDAYEKLYGKFGKADDLADSLLQGMAWLRWEANQALLAQDGGIYKLLGQDVP